MASNTTLNTGSGGDTAVTKERTHDGDAAKQQGVFISGVSGSEGSYTFVDVDAGGGAEAAALRVTIANDSTGLLSVDDNGSSLTVDNAALSVTGGGAESTALRVTLASDSTGVLSVDDNGSSLTVDGTVTANAGTNLNTSALLTTSAFNTVLGSASLILATQADDVVNTSDGLQTTSFGYVFDGTTWDRMRGDSSNGLLVNLGGNNDVTVTGSVTANAGTNLNTSALLTTSAFNTVLGSASLILTTQADNVANTADGLQTTSFGYAFDGSTWDRMRGDSTNGLLVNLGSNNDVTVTGTVGHNTTGVADGVTTVTTAGTDVALASSTSCKWVIIQAQTDNTGWIAVGNSGVDATVATGTGVLLGPGESITIPTDNLADINIDATVNGEGVRYTYGT